jgi:choline dehydrogenase-like flavoprotein
VPLAADVVVCGAGAAGMAAAIAAARQAARVLLVESGQQTGGTVAHALIHTLAGLYDSAGEFLNGGLPRELAQRLLAADPRTGRRKMGRVWVLNVCPETYRRVTENWLAQEPQITVLTTARLTSIKHQGGRIVEVVVAAPDRRLRLHPAAVIDATGTADVVRLVDSSLVLDDDRAAAAGWIVRLAGVTAGALDFPKGLAVVRALRAAAAAGELPRECSHAWIDVGIDPDEAFLKLVPLDRPWREAERNREHAQAAQATTAAVLDFLHQWPDFAQARIAASGCLGVRDGGRIRGRYVLSVDDVRTGRQFDDAACRCAWPIEYWDPQEGVSIEYLPPGSHYEIPLRSLQVKGIDNLYAAGKCLSADRLAHASARVVGSCWAMGEAVGAAAAAERNSREDARELVRAVS